MNQEKRDTKDRELDQARDRFYKTVDRFYTALGPDTGKGEVGIASKEKQDRARKNAVKNMRMSFIRALEMVLEIADTHRSVSQLKLAIRAMIAEAEKQFSKLEEKA